MMQETDNDDKKSTLKEEFQRMNFRPIWRARCITPYNPELLPSEAVPLREEVNQNHNLSLSSHIFDNSCRFKYCIVIIVQMNYFNTRH